jgi:hypothetical protein
MPPKAFFPRGGTLQLKTVPSCPDHNNAKSGDDQYLLAHITIHAASGDNLAKQIFMRSILPQLKRAPKFAAGIARGSIRMDEGAVAYSVDVRRFDRFFDHLCYALYFDRYHARFDEHVHLLSHHYLSLTTDDPEEVRRLASLSDWLRVYYVEFSSSVESHVDDHIDEVVYQNRIIDPVGPHASITIAHTFYGVFDVVSLLTQRPPGAQEP